MDFIHLWRDDRALSKILRSTIPIPVHGLKVKVTDFEFPVTDLIILAGNEDMHKILDKFEFRSDRTTDYGVNCPWASKK